MAVTRTVFIDTSLSDYQSLAAQYGADTFNVVLLNATSPHADQIQNWLTAHNARATDINIVSASDSVNGAFTPRVVFVDAGVANIGQVIAGVPANATVVVLDAGRDGVQQIHDYLAANAGKVGAIDIVTDLASVDVVSHGAPGEVTLGSTVLNADTLATYSKQLAEIGSHLTAGADLLLYGCDVASGTTGQQFISALANATGADVAASTDLTGSAAAGGDWVLEANTGTIETAALDIAGYDGVLGQTISNVHISPDSGANGADLITRLTVQTVTFTVNGDSSPIYVTIDNGNKTVATWVSKTNGKDNYTVQVNAVSGDGSHTIQFWSENGTSAFATQAYTLDTSMPNPGSLAFSGLAYTGIDGGPTSDRNFSLALTGNEAGASVVYEVSFNNGAYASTTTAQTNLAEGSYRFHAIVTDAAGNSSTTNIASVTIDGTAPLAPAISATAALTNNKSPVLTITAEADSTVQVYDGANLLGTATQTATGGTYTFATANLGEGAHSFTATAKDAAGNLSAASTAKTVTVDTVAPNAPAISTSATLTNNKAPVLTITAEADSTVQVYDGANLIGTATQTATKGTYTFATANLAEGGHAFTATAKDAAGNVSAASTAQTVTVDTIAPNAPAISTTAALTNNKAPVLTITAEADSTVQVYDGANLLGTATQTATKGTYTFATANLAEGGHAFTATAKDAAGNLSAASTAQTVTVDTIAPGAPAIATTAALTNNKAPVLTISAEADSTVQVYDGANLLGTATQTATKGTYTFATANLAEGGHAFTATAKDGAGNVSAASTAQTVTVDTIAPNAPAISTAAALTNNKAPVLTIAAEADSTVQVYEGTTLLGTATQTATKGTYTFATANLADGSHAFTATAKDGAGNVSAASTAQTVTVDTVAPVPTITMAKDSGSGNNHLSNDPHLNFSALEQNATRVVKLDGNTVGAYDASALHDGQHTVIVTDTDAAGNTGSTSLTFMLDTTAPAPGTLGFDGLARSGGDNGPTNDRDFSLALSGNEAGSTVAYEVSTDNGASFHATTAAQASLADGSYQFRAVVTDAAGNSATTSVASVTIDATAPNAPGISTAAALTNNKAPVLTIAAEADSTVQVYEGTTLLGTATQTATRGTYTFATANLADGSHAFTATAKDGAGNVSAASTAQTITVDTVAPVPTITMTKDSGTGDNHLSNDPHLSFGALEQNATRVIQLDGNTVGAYDASALHDGQHTVIVTDTDAAGNAGSASLTFTLDTTAPAPSAALAKDSGSDGSDGITNDANLTFSTLEDGATRVIKVDGTAVASYDPKSLKDGAHTVEITDTDVAGNAGSKSYSFTLDTTAPAPTAALAKDSGSDGSDGITNDASLILSTLEDGATRVIKVDGSAVGSYDPKALADGSHTVEVTDTDVAGNAGSKSYSFTLDTTAPAPTAALAKDSGSNGSDGITNDANLTFSTLEDGASRIIKVDGTAVASYDPKALADGTHTVEITDTDVAGNAGSKSYSFTLDTAAPAPTAALTQDSGSNGSDGITNDANLTFSTLEDGATRVIKVDGTAVASYDPKSLKDGAHTVEITDTDVAGNAGSKSYSFTLDTAAPAPTAALAKDSGSDGSDGVTNDASLTLSTLEDGATRVIKVDGTAVGSYDPKSLKDGAHTVEVTDTDVAGNAGSKSYSFTLDTTAPAPTAALAKDSGSDGSDGITNDASLILSTLEDGATRVIKVDGTAVASYDPKSLADGSHTVEVNDTDVAGNAGSKSYSFTLDTTAPAPTAALTKDSGSNGSDGITNDASLTLSTLEANASRVIKVDGNVVSGYDPKTLADGSHTVEVTDTDVAGNAGSKSYSFTLDTTAPAPTAALAQDSGSNGSDSITNDASLTLSTLEDGATRVIKVDGTAVASYDPKALKDGTHTVEVTDTDVAGNAGSKSYSFTLDTAAPAPTATLAKDSGSNGSDGITNDASLTLSTLEDGATRVIKVDGSAVGSYDPKALADGSHTVEVIDTDVAGNAGSKSYSFTLDTAAPAPTAALAKDSGSNGSDGITNDANLTLSTLEDGATRVIKVDGTAVASYDPKSLKDGTHTVEITDTDVAGNAGSKSYSFTLDTAAPAPTAALTQDSGSNGSDGITNDANLTFSTLEDGATRVIKVDGTAVASYDPKSLKDGAHTVEVTDTDVAGNAGSKSYSFTLDTTAPAPSAVLVKDSGSNGSDSITNDASLTLSVLEDGATRLIKVDGTAVASYDPKSLKDGTHTVEVTDTDTAGNAGSKSYSFTLDTTAPAPTAALAKDSGSNGSDGITNDASLTFSTLENGATRIVKVDGTAVGSYDPKALANGSHTIEVTDTDVAGNAGSKSYSFTLDTTAPAPTAALVKDTGTSDKDGITNDASLTLSALEANGSRVIKIDGNVVGSYDPKALADGAHTVVVTDTDAAGNAGSQSLSFTLDTQGPAFSSAASASVAENSGANQLVYTAAATDAHGVSYSFADTDTATKFDISADGKVTLKDNPNYESVPTYGFTVVATDAAGNHTNQAVTLNITNVNEAPTAPKISGSTVENVPVDIHVADSISDPDAGDKLTVSLNTTSAKLSWANTDPKAPTALTNPVTHATVDLSTLSVKASVAADGTVTLTPPAELDWMTTGQALKATFSYTVTDTGGLSSTESIELVINGSTSDKGVNLVGGNGDDVLSGNATNNAEDVIQGNNGNDTLNGYGGTDALYGGNGNDKLYGGAGIDYLYGDNGDDTIDGGADGDYIYGGKGNDLLTGGGGADKFVFAPQGGADRITDFKAGDGDMLYFTDFFTTAPDWNTFASKYVTDTGNDLLVSLPGGTSVVLVGVPNISDLAGHVVFGSPA